MLEPGISVSFVARKHGLSPSLPFKWKGSGRPEGGGEEVRADDVVVGAARLRQLEERIRELERLLGRKTLEARSSTRRSPPPGQKTAVALAVARSGPFPMKAVTDTLRVARSHLVEQAKRGGRWPRPPYRKARDAELLACVRPLVDARPSYRYRWITARLNHQADAEGLARANHMA